MAKLVENRAAPHCGFPDNQVGNNRCSIEIHHERAQRVSRERERGRGKEREENTQQAKGKTSRETLRSSDALNS